MKTSSLPLRFIAIAGMVVFFLVLLVLEFAIVSEPFWMNPTVKNAVLWTGGMAIGLVPISVFLGRANRSVLEILVTVVFIWLLFITGLSFYVGSAFIGLIQVLVVLTWLTGWLSLRFRMDRSFVNPNRFWFESVPKFIPNLICEVKAKDRSEALDFRACRFDRDGAFLFPKKKEFKFDIGKSAFFYFKFRDRVFEYQGKIRNREKKTGGFGVRFEKLSRDQKKELGDLVERLDGGGYV